MTAETVTNFCLDTASSLRDCLEYIRSPTNFESLPQFKAAFVSAASGAVFSFKELIAFVDGLPSIGHSVHVVVEKLKNFCCSGQVKLLTAVRIAKTYVENYIASQGNVPMPALDELDDVLAEFVSLLQEITESAVLYSFLIAKVCFFGYR